MSKRVKTRLNNSKLMRISVGHLANVCHKHIHQFVRNNSGLLALLRHLGSMFTYLINLWGYKLELGLKFPDADLLLVLLIQ